MYGHHPNHFFSTISSSWSDLIHLVLSLTIIVIMMMIIIIMIMKTVLQWS